MNTAGLPPGAIAANELEYWASLGNLPNVEAALRSGADVNAAASEGYSALHAAAENGHAAIVTMLASHA